MTEINANTNIRILKRHSLIIAKHMLTETCAMLTERNGKIREKSGIMSECRKRYVKHASSLLLFPRIMKLVVVTVVICFGVFALGLAASKTLLAQ